MYTLRQVALLTIVEKTFFLLSGIFFVILIQSFFTELKQLDPAIEGHLTYGVEG